MSVGINEIVEFYDNMLPKMAMYHTHQNSRLDKIKSQLKDFVRPNAQVLDIGCGTGITSKFMADIGACVTAIDISPMLIEYAKKFSYHSSINYVIGDISAFKSNTRFDIITFIDVIEHIRDDHVYPMMKSIVKNNSHESSIIYLNTPNFNFIEFMADKYPDKLQIIDNGYSVDFIVNMLSLFGFSPVHVEIYGIDVNVQYTDYIFMATEFLKKYYKDNFMKRR